MAKVPKVLHEPTEREFICAVAGDKSWTDYTLTLKARKISGDFHRIETDVDISREFVYRPALQDGQTTMTPESNVSIVASARFGAIARRNHCIG